MTSLKTARSCESVETLLLGSSPAMAQTRALVNRVAKRNASILVTGPSGSGKERVARALHAESDRRDGPFVAINCGAIPRDLLESELFGHEKGSFTGAHAARSGRFEEAHGGTLFLDEIGDMPHDMQVKLLRVLEERVVERVGGRAPIRVDVRIVSATHRDLAAAIEAGTFREDLYYRLAVFPIELAPLSSRTEDIPQLVAHFLSAMDDRRASLRFTAPGLARLADHDWPGNLRELRNIVERAAILHPGEAIGSAEVDRLITRRAAVSALDLRAEVPGLAAAPTMAPLLGSEGIDLRQILGEIESRYIHEALQRTGGVVAEAARMLGLQRTTLIEKMRRYPA